MAARLAKNAMPNFMMSVMPSATSDAAYFTNIFRDSEGVAPKEWRKHQHPK